MKKNYLLMILSVLCLFTFFFSCAQDELNAHKTEKDQEILNNSSIQVVDGYLSFADDNVFKNYLTALQENANELFITRAVTNAWQILGFTSIASSLLSR